MDQDELRAAFLFQSRACAAFGSPFYARLLATAAERLDSGFRALFAPWEGCSEATLIGHAVALRFVGSLHDIVLEHADAELVAAFPPAAGDGAAAWPAVLGAGRRHSERITRFMAHEPQTNAVRRSACLLAGFLLIDAETGLPLRRLELGASAGRLADDGTGCSPMSTRTAPGSTGPQRSLAAARAPRRRRGRSPMREATSQRK